MHRVGKVVPPKRHILKDISLSFFPGAKIGVLGLNGAGKSTLLRIMAGVDKEFEGEARPQPGIKIGYLPQEPKLDPQQTVREAVEEAVGEVKHALTRLDEVYALYADPDADFDKLAAEQAELEAIIQAHDGHNLDNQLERAADALRLPDWDAKIEHLSGGERRRVALCRLLLEKPDMLLLDEPTNHLDITSKQVLEDALENYEGTIVFVSHDRYFINKIANKVLDITGDDYSIYLGNYDYYLEKREQELIAKKLKEEKTDEVQEKVANDYVLGKEEKKRIRKLERTREELLEKIESLEEKVTLVNNELTKEEVYTDAIKVQEYNEELRSLNQEIEDLNNTWLEIEEELESLQ